ncbi:MAG: Rab family GTPase [Candidatus Hodarchaeales archaeon]|jgi:small GTP-binding protein
MQNKEGKNGFLYKICLCGDGGVGKTAILERFLGKEFNTKYKTTIGAEIAVYNMKIGDFLLKYQIWDLAGQPHFKFVRQNFYKGSHAIIMIFDRNRPDTLNNLWTWVKEIQANIGYTIPVILLGNKNDLKEQSRIDQDIIFNFIEEVRNCFSLADIPFLYTSAFLGDNIFEAFETIGQKIIRYYPEHFNQVIAVTQKVVSY